MASISSPSFWQQHDRDGNCVHNMQPIAFSGMARVGELACIYCAARHVPPPPDPIPPEPFDPELTKGFAHRTWP